MQKNMLLVGAGYFAQRVHLPVIKKLKLKSKIFIFDERQNLAKLVAKKFKLNFVDKLNQSFIKKNHVDFALVCYTREKSFYFSKKLLQFNLNVICEKPAAFELENIKKLILLAKKKKKIFRICYQKNFFNSVKFIKKNLKRIIKKYGEITHIHFELFNGDMRLGTKSFCRTKEKVLNKSLSEKIRTVPENLDVNYKIFANRYIHSINLFHNIFNFLSAKPKINFKIISKTNYVLNLYFKRKNISFLFGDYKYSKWHDHVNIFFEKAKISLKMVAPLDFKKKPELLFYDGNKKKNIKIKLKKNNIFFDQFKNFLKDLKNKNSQNFYDHIYLKDYSLINKIWKSY